MVSDHDIDLNLTGFARLHLPWRGLFHVLSRSAVAIWNAVGLPFAWVGLTAPWSSVITHGAPLAVGAKAK
jgi:hypothetical protein